VHLLGDGVFGYKPLYSQGFLRFRVFYLRIRGSSLIRLTINIFLQDNQTLPTVEECLIKDNDNYGH